MASAPTSPWIVYPRPNRTAALRLLALPYAGAGASIFRTWPAALPADVELLAIELPGRETRFGERPYQRLTRLVEALVDAVGPGLVAPFAIYGHSLGALLGFHVARELRRRSLPGPVHLLVSGRRAPHLIDPAPMHQLPEPQFLARLRRLGGIPDAVFQETELMARFLPILRADFALTEAEPYAAGSPLSCPITALGGTTDENARLDELDAWQVHTADQFERETFPGGHFFIQTGRAPFLAALSRRLQVITSAR